MELVDADTRIRERIRAVNSAAAALGSLSQKVEGDLERLDREAARWPHRVALAREREAPAEILQRAEAAGPELAATRDRLRARRDELLVAYERGVALQARLDAVRGTIVERRERITAELRTFEDAPVWRQGPIAFPRDEVLALMRLSRLELVDYLRQYGARLGLLIVVLASLMFVALKRRPVAAPVPEGLRARSTGLAAVGALLGSLVLLAVLAPRGPFIFYRLIAFAVPLAGGVVAARTFAASIPATVWALVFAVFVNEFRVLAELNPGTDRLLLAVQLLPFGAALVHDWRRGALARFLPRWPAVLVHRLAMAMLLALGIIVIASMAGYTGTARRLAAPVVMAPGFALVFAALAWVLDRAIEGLLATPIAQSFRSVRARGDAIRHALHLVVVLFCWGTGIVAFMLAQSALDDLLRIGNYVAGASVTAGEVTITLSAILLALAIVGVTWLSTKLVRFVLDHEILPRLDLRTGVPIAISTIVGYLLVVTGFVLALAALGIDLTKVTLLAGALGVGVGLGLQSVVNNFASGLILMVERPINVGDQIDIGGVLGEVKRIGVRVVDHPHVPGSRGNRPQRGPRVQAGHQLDLVGSRASLRDRRRRRLRERSGEGPARARGSGRERAGGPEGARPARALHRIRRQLARLSAVRLGRKRRHRAAGAEQPPDGGPAAAPRGGHRDSLPAARRARSSRSGGAPLGRRSARQNSGGIPVPRSAGGGARSPVIPSATTTQPPPIAL